MYVVIKREKYSIKLKILFLILKNLFLKAPESMKACMMAIRMLTNAIGNVLDVVVIAALGMVLHKISIITFFGHKHFLKKARKFI